MGKDLPQGMPVPVLVHVLSLRRVSTRNGFLSGRHRTRGSSLTTSVVRLSLECFPVTVFNSFLG